MNARKNLRAYTFQMNFFDV